MISLEWDRDEGNEPVATWSCKPDSQMQKPCLASHIKSCNSVHIGIVTITEELQNYIMLFLWCSDSNNASCCRDEASAVVDVMIFARHSEFLCYIPQ